MSTVHAEEQDHGGEADGVILSPEEEAALVQRLAETDESEQIGQLIPWEKLRAERGM